MRKRHLELSKTKASLLIVIVLSSIISFNIAFSIISAKAAAIPEDKPNFSTLNITNSAQLANYASEYAEGHHNPNDTLYLTLFTSEHVWYLPEEGENAFEGIGTADRPFNGTVVITSGTEKPFYLAKSLFAYATTNLKIVDENHDDMQIEICKIKEDDSAIFIENLVDSDYTAATVQPTSATFGSGTYYKRNNTSPYAYVLANSFDAEEVYYVQNTSISATWDGEVFHLNCSFRPKEW